MYDTVPRLIPRSTPLYRIPLHTVCDKVCWILSVWGPMNSKELVFRMLFEDYEEKEKRVIARAMDAKLIEIPRGSENMVSMALQDLVAQRRIAFVSGKYQCVE